MVFVAALILGLNVVTTAPADPSTRPSAPPSVERWIDLVPDNASAEAGALPFNTFFSFRATTLIDGRLTSHGCISSLVDPPKIQWRFADGARPHFEATSRREWGAVVTWKGAALYNGYVSGEIVITLPGEALPREVVEPKHKIDPDAIRAKYSQRNARGELINAAELKQRELDAAFDRNMALARGRTLRFTFPPSLPEEVVAPATQPVQAPR